jgi:glycosyltransferase involved in cell wall biosynthesis
MNHPLISCKTITYGRVEMLEEALHSFLQQDYPGEKEMVIVNDYPLQKLIFDHPQVKIFNLNETFSTIGEKENFATKQCTGNIVCQWDDDDIAMPNHLVNVAKFFIPGSNILHWKKGVYYNEPNITSVEWIGNSGIVFNKEAWEKIGGHPIMNAGYDMKFVQKLHTLGGVVYADPPYDEASWWYMWGGRGYHMSGEGDDVPGKDNVILRHSRHIESLRRKGKIPTGDVVLKPNWKKDYPKILKDFVSRRYQKS